MTQEIDLAPAGRLAGLTSARSLHTVPRVRLFDQFGLEPRRKVTVLQAPAGYGKSEFLVQWLSALQSRGLRSALLRLDESHSDLQRLLAAMTAALGRLGLETPDLLAGDTEGGDALCRAALSMVANVLGSTKRPLTILIDDTHFIRSNETLRAFEALLQHTPDHVRFILATRYKPMLSLARIAAAGQLARLIGQTLLFTPEETALALRGLSSHEQAIEIHALTCGWPALINLVVADPGFPVGLGALRRGPIGGRMVDFLESILTQVRSEAVSKCITASAVSERFGAALAGVLSNRDDAEGLLDMALQSGVPLIVQDGTKDFAYPRLMRMWLMSTLRTDPTTSLATLRERCARWLTAQGRAQDAARQILQGRLRTLADFAVLESRGLSLIWGFGPEALAAYLPLPMPHTRYPRLTRAHSLARKLKGREPEVVPTSDAYSAVDDIPDEENEQLLTNAWHCVLADIAVGDSAMTGLQALAAKLEEREANDLADISRVLLAICAFNVNDTSGTVLHGLAAHDRLVARGRPYGAYLAQLYCGFAAAQAGLLVPALAHFRACATLAATESLGEESLSRSQTCVFRILCWLGAPPPIDNPAGTELRDARTCVESIPPAFEARIEMAYRASLARGTSAQARAILEQGAAQARARGWRRVAAGLECSLIDHVGRFGAPENVVGRLECLASEVAALHSPHLEQRMALAGVRIRIIQGDLEEARRQLDGVFPATDTEPTTLAVCTALLRFGILLARGDSRLSEQASTRLLNLAEQCPCVGLLAPDIELLSRHVETDTARRRLTAMIAQLDSHSRVILQSATSQMDPPDTNPCALSPRERDVLDLIASGMSRRETSEFLGVSESSVKSYQASLFRKLGVMRRSDVIQEAKRHGFWHSQIVLTS